MRLLVYTLLRLGLVLASAGLLYLLGLRSWFLWMAAVVVGALVSFLVLRRQREEAAHVLAQFDPLREERPTFSADVEADAAYEDAVVDAAAERREHPAEGGEPVADDRAGRPASPMTARAARSSPMTPRAARSSPITGKGPQHRSRRTRRNTGPDPLRAEARPRGTAVRRREGDGARGVRQRQTDAQHLAR
ncbi:DUF4229 domain-containing protein [Georgenia sp. SUBG003]|uniref:DUF4229 domain-containing protein n=1 Tax=Georgenia sp. SUBG003 TaxID=1497974 RepID=UPI003AB399BB